LYEINNIKRDISFIIYTTKFTMKVTTMVSIIVKIANLCILETKKIILLSDEVAINYNQYTILFGVIFKLIL